MPLNSNSLVRGNKPKVTIRFLQTRVILEGIDLCALAPNKVSDQEYRFTRGGDRYILRLSNGRSFCIERRYSNGSEFTFSLLQNKSVILNKETICFVKGREVTRRRRLISDVEARILLSLALGGPSSVTDEVVSF